MTIFWLVSLSHVLKHRCYWERGFSTTKLLEKVEIDYHADSTFSSDIHHIVKRQNSSKLLLESVYMNSKYTGAQFSPFTCLGPVSFLAIIPRFILWWKSEEKLLLSMQIYISTFWIILKCCYYISMLRYFQKSTKISHFQCAHANCICLCICHFVKFLAHKIFINHLHLTLIYMYTYIHIYTYIHVEFMCVIRLPQSLEISNFLTACQKDDICSSTYTVDHITFKHVFGWWFFKLFEHNSVSMKTKCTHIYISFIFCNHFEVVTYFDVLTPWFWWLFG